MTITEKAETIIALHKEARKFIRADLWRSACLVLVKAIDLSSDIANAQQRLYHKAVHEPSLN